MSEQADFAWIPESKGLAKLFMGSQARRNEADGRSLRFFVYPWGIHWIDGDEEVSARWTDVDVWREVTRHYANGVAVATEYRYTVQVADGPAKIIHGRLRPGAARSSEAARLVPRQGTTTMVTVEQLGRLIESGVTRSHLPWVLDRFRGGHPVSFGPLTVSRGGITAGDQSVSWSEIQEVRTVDGLVSVRRGGKWIPWKRVRVSKIANYFVFEALVRSVLTQRPAAPLR
jgi:hypothetical protein